MGSERVDRGRRCFGRPCVTAGAGCRRGWIKGYFVVAESVQEAAAEAGEQLSDLVAEVQAERAASTTAATAPGQPSQTYGQS